VKSGCTGRVPACGHGSVRPKASPHAWARHTPVPILVYHHVHGYLAGNYLMYVGTSQFASQLWYLRHHGYHPVTMQQVWDAWTGGEELPRRPVVLSSDDGYPDQYSNAAGQLRSYHWPAVLNLVVHRGTALSDAQVRRMVKWAGRSARTRSVTPSSRASLRRRCAASYLAATSIRYGAATPLGRFGPPAHRRLLGRIPVDVRQQDASGGRPSPLAAREHGLRRLAGPGRARCATMRSRDSWGGG
jgi:hypothetical protein